MVDPQELADLVTKHDQERPDHGDDCGCHNGIIPTLRIYFGPPIQPGPDEYAPYIPPETKHAESKPHPGEDRRPWLKQRGDEDRQQYDFRISHSCYNCGTFIVDKNLLNVHEDQCSHQGKRDNK